MAPPPKKQETAALRPVITLAAVVSLMPAFIAACIDETASPLAPYGVALQVILQQCPDFPPDWEVYGCRSMTSQELSGLTSDFESVFPAMIYPSGWAECGDFREGGEDFLDPNQWTLLVFDSLLWLDHPQPGDTTVASAFVWALEGVGGVRVDRLGTTQGALSVFHEGGHLAFPEMPEHEVRQWTLDCFDNFGQELH